MKPLPRPFAARRLALVGVVTLGVLAASAGVASAHVTVSSPGASAGGYTVLTFQVPTESATASTVKVTVSMPTATPLASVAVAPVPGWTVAAPEKALATPVTTDDGQVTQAVTQVTWSATAGGLKPGEFGQFQLSVGPLPDVAQLAFPTVQTYSDGSEVDWVEQPAAGSTAEPEHPAPTLELGAASKGSNGSSTSSPTVAASNDVAASSSGSSSGLAVTGVALGAVGLLLGAAALVVALRRRSTP